MDNIPPEFAPYKYYLEAAAQFQSRYPDISDVLNKCFSDSCQDLIDEGNASPEAQEYLNQFNDSHTNPPDEAIQQTKQVADKFYQILKKQFDAGKFSPTLEKQLGLTSILYSVLEGEDDKCEQCKEMRKTVQNVLIGSSATSPALSPPGAPGAYGSAGGPPAYTPPAAPPAATGSTGGPPVFTPPTASPAATGSAGGPPVFTPPAASPAATGSTGGPPIFTPPAASPTIPNALEPDAGTPSYPTIPSVTGSSGGPPVFTSTGYGSPQPPSFTPTTSTNSSMPPPSFNQSNNNTMQNSINIPSSAQTSPPPYGSFPPTAQQQKPQQNFDATAAVSYLNSLGYTIINSSMYPALNNSTYSVIQAYLDHAINSLKNNDSAQGLASLQDAFKVWSTGSQIK